jgi:hypothetical protein
MLGRTSTPGNWKLPVSGRGCRIARRRVHSAPLLVPVDERSSLPADRRLARPCRRKAPPVRWSRELGSFRDPSGFIFTLDGGLYRQVNATFSQHYRRLLASGLYDELVRDRLIAVLKPEYVPFISESTEGSFTARKSLERWHHFNTAAYLRFEKLVWCYVGPRSYYRRAKGKGTLSEQRPLLANLPMLLTPLQLSPPRNELSIVAPRCRTFKLAASGRGRLRLYNRGRGKSGRRYVPQGSHYRRAKGKGTLTRLAPPAGRLPKLSRAR